MCGLITAPACPLVGHRPAAVGLLATQTRTALLGIGGRSHRGDREPAQDQPAESQGAGDWTGVVVLVVGLPLSPLVNAWLVRGQN